MRLNSLDEVLRFAIRKEADAAAFYRMAADRSTSGAKEIFEELSKEEEGHKKKLESFDVSKLDPSEMKEITVPGMGEIMEDVPYSSDMNYADALRMAIKNEEKAHHLYISTSKLVVEPTLKKLLLALAQEESTHKEKLERIYDREVLREF